MKNIYHYKVSNSVQFEDISILDGGLQLQSLTFMYFDPRNPIISIIGANATFLVDGSKKTDKLLITVPPVFGEILFYLSKDILLDKLMEQTGYIENIIDEWDFEEETEDPFGWGDWESAADAVAGIITGSISQYVIEKYKKQMDSQLTIELIDGIVDLIADSVQSEAEQFAEIARKKGMKLAKGSKNFVDTVLYSFNEIFLNRFGDSLGLCNDGNKNNHEIPAKVIDLQSRKEIQ